MTRVIENDYIDGDDNVALTNLAKGGDARGVVRQRNGKLFVGVFDRRDAYFEFQIRWLLLTRSRGRSKYAWGRR